MYSISMLRNPNCNGNLGIILASSKVVGKTINAKGSCFDSTIMNVFLFSLTHLMSKLIFLFVGTTPLNVRVYPQKRMTKINLVVIRPALGQLMLYSMVCHKKRWPFLCGDQLLLLLHLNGGAV